MSTLRVLMDRLIDYAGLFPPAELAMRQAVENYQNYLRGPDRWMLGRFVVPASRLTEFEAAKKELADRSGDERPWLLSALVAPAHDHERFLTDVAEIQHFNQRQQSGGGPAAIVDSIESKASAEADVLTAASQVMNPLALFLELPLDENLDRLLTAINDAQRIRNVMAKIRTGGVVAEAIPTVDRVAAFVSGCAGRQIGYKATAGLHHPIRASYRLTYREKSPCAVMFGFLNVFMAACAAMDDPADLDQIEMILGETDATRFRFGDDAIQWRQTSWPISLVRSMRWQAVSFGSCSFVEPTDELRALGLPS